jgi:thiamine biosynthesis lipoprotein
MPISIHVRGPGAARAEVDAAALAAFAELRAVDATFSTYRADSEIRRLARGELAFPDASPLVHEVIGLCGQARQRTHGAFDARMRTPDGRRVFDPSGLVKGWAAERAFAALAALDDVDAYLNAGGDVVTSCRASERPGWRIGIEDPIAPPGLVGAVELRGGAIATSGTAHRGLHIRDPATGVPVESVASVTVVGPSLLWADVFATAAFVRGAGGLDLLPRSEGYEGLIVAPDGRLTRTPGFRFAGEAHAVPGWRGRPDEPSSLRQAWQPLPVGEA